MTKIAIITDTHFGARDGRAIFHDYFEKFYTNTFFPTLAEHGITDVLHLGDLFDRRKYIDYYSLKRCREYFFDPLCDAGIDMHCLVGNHDIALRNTLDINSPELLLSEYPNIHPIADPTVINVHGTSFMMLPWICADNYAKSMAMLKEDDAEVVCGHLEIAGFAMYKGMESHEGFDANLFKRFDLVVSGHYHHRSSNGNIHYLGNPYELTWQDFNDPRGFHIFETKTKTLEFVRNPYSIFTKIEYNDAREQTFDFGSYVDRFIKVVVSKKSDLYSFDVFMDKLYNCGAHDIKVMDIIQEELGEMDETIDIENTMTIMSHYIENTKFEGDVAKLEQYMKLLYTEAMNTSF